MPERLYIDGQRVTPAYARHVLQDGKRHHIDLAITPGGRVGDASPLGHKGKRRVLDDYVREVAHALMRKGFSKSHAIATAKNSLKKWRRGGGKVRPQVRAGATAHLGIQEALDKRGGGGKFNLSYSMGGSSQDGGRVTMRSMTPPARKKRIRPGSIPSGKGKGKFPITSQRDVRAAASLLHKAKGVSQETIKAHVKREAKKRGLKLTPAFKDHTTPRQALEAAVATRARELDLTITDQPGTFDFDQQVERRLAVAQEIAARRLAAQ